MKEYKKYLSSGLIEKVTAEGYQGFLELTTVYPISEARKSGEIILYLLKIGLDLLDIDELLDIRSSTIERRVLQHLREKEKRGEDTYQDCKFLFENVKGLEYFTMYKRFLNTNVKEAEFRKKEGISREVLKKLKIRMDLKGVEKYQEEIQNRKKEMLIEEQNRRKPSENPSRNNGIHLVNCIYIA